MHDFLHSTLTDGIAVVTGGPPGADTLAQFGRWIGMVDHTHYGRTWKVEAKANPMNNAYMHLALPLHTDDTSLTQSPELQMLHCVRPAAQGGATNFVDGFAVAEFMRRQHREQFDLLAKYEYESVQEGFSDEPVNPDSAHNYDYKFAAMHRLISLHPATGRVDSIHYSNHMRSYFFDCPFDELNALYGAWLPFERLAMSDQFNYRLRLESGDTALFMNTRVMHARESYEIRDHNRLFIGCYFRLHHVQSAIRMLQARLKMRNDQPSL